MGLLLYSRRGCHLCEAAEDLLAAWRCAVEVIDVDVDPATAAAYGDRVPVLVRDGAVVLEGRFDDAGIARLLGDRGPSSPEFRGRG
ncbi:MAG: glutaredoxin family protein [Planctomycetaceae bacterium]